MITFTDITELRQARELLKESEAFKRLAAVVHDSNDAVILQDMEGHILAWNPRAEQIYGWSEAEALKMSISSIVPENRKEQELSTIKRLSRAEVLESYRTQRLSKNGRIVDVWLTSSLLVDKDANPYAIATTERGIKEQNMEDRD